MRSRVVPGLDGLRGIAVLAVMAFHAGITWLRGGLLGVDVFFVLSGYLITSLLLAERSGTGRIDLRAFWARRARRLLPALLVLLAGISVYARWSSSGISPARVRGDALASLFYVANWHFVLTGQNYFVRFGALSPVLHTWSLAVEEQFYLVWPLVVVLVLRRFGRRGVGWAAGSLTAASAALCGVLYLAGASVDRLYYGTDTRAQALMVGALLAAVLPLPGALPGGGTRPERRGPRGLAAARWLVPAGLAGAAVLGFSLHAVEGSGPYLYEGGFLVVALATALVVAVAVGAPRSVLARALSWRPLRYTGRISYGLYLYHWPVFLLMTETRTGVGGTALTVLRFGATFAIAAVSYHLIETPVRSGRVPLVGRLASWLTLRRAGAMAAAGVLAALATVASGVPGEAGAAVAAGEPAGAAAFPPGVDPAHPERGVLIGDSMALTLGEGLSVDSSAWGISLANDGVLGCDLDPSSTVNIMGTVSKAAQGCTDWRGAWKRLVSRTDPDVVVVLLGRWESIDRLYQGRWTTVGEPAFDRHLRSELSEIVDIGSARGARVVFLTLPYISQTTVQPNGAPWDMNRPARTDAYNADVRAVVAQHPNQAAVIDLNKMLDPAGHYVSYIDKVRVRDYDDEHLSKAGGLWLRSRILPDLVRLGAAHHTGSTRGGPGAR